MIQAEHCHFPAAADQLTLPLFKSPKHLIYGGCKRLLAARIKVLTAQ